MIDLKSNLENKKRLEREWADVQQAQDEQHRLASDAHKLYIELARRLDICVRCYPGERAHFKWGDQDLHFAINDNGKLICYWTPIFVFQTGSGQSTINGGEIMSFYIESIEELSSWITRVLDFMKKHVVPLHNGQKLVNIDTGNTRRGYREPSDPRYA